MGEEMGKGEGGREGLGHRVRREDKKGGKETRVREGKVR